MSVSCVRMVSVPDWASGVSPMSGRVLIMSTETALNIGFSLRTQPKGVGFPLVFELAENLTFNQQVSGSSPDALTKEVK